MPTYKKTEPSRNRILVGIPYTGLLRAEWVMARYSQVIPCNWAQVEMIRWLDPHSPLGFMVADARNIIANVALKEDFEWLWFIDHDVVLPQGTTLMMNKYMLDAKVPLVSGLYFTKGVPSEPLIYRKRGTGYYTDWKMGEKVWVDGVPMGCTLIHGSLLRAVADEVCEYEVEGKRLKMIFETPSRTFIDPEGKAWENATGTEDLEFCSRIIEHDLLAKAGWHDIAKQEFPFLIDTSIYCKHIDMNGTQFPNCHEELQFMPDIDKKAKEDDAFKSMLGGVKKELKVS